MAAPVARGNCGPLTTRSSRRGLVALDVVIAVALCLWGWAEHERCCLRREQKAKNILKHDYRASAIGPLSSDSDGSGRKYDEQYIDLRELQWGRLYTPIHMVVFHKGTVVDNRALRQLASFRYLESLDFEQCRIEPDAEFRPPWASRLKGLNLDRTPITNSQLRSISRLRGLERLTLYAKGLGGNCLEPASRLRCLTVLTMSDGDLSDGAADSLARIKGLTWLYLCQCKIDSRLGPALGRLENLEFLDIYDAPFDDEGVKHLTSLKHLDDLRLGRTAITDDGMASVAKLTSLTKLELSETKVGDAGLRHLQKLPKLAVLDIAVTRATNSCLRNLVAMPSLKFAHVGGTAIKPRSAGFIGVLDESIGYWYPNEARAKEAEGDEEDEKGASHEIRAR